MNSPVIDRPISVVAARQLLRDVSNVPSERIDAARAAVAAFYNAKPRHQSCAACGCMQFSEHETRSGDAVWCCASCHRSAALTAEAWAAEWARDRKAADETATAAAAAVAAQPAPRVILKQRLAALAEARAGLQKLEAAAPAARSRVWDLQAELEAAEQAAAEANTGAAANLAEALTNGKQIGPASPAAKARAEHADAVDALSVAKSARVILEGKLTEAKSQVDFAFDKCRKAARTVIAAERLEDLIGDAVEARANYLESVGALGWLVRSHAINGDDRRAHQILGDANVPPSAWAEAIAGAGTEVMQAAFEALMLDAAAVI